MNPTAPIITIGAGRSGSTLLARMLGAHPDIYFGYDETNFLTVNMWQSIFGEHNEPHLRLSTSMHASDPAAQPDPHQPDQLLEKKRRAVSATISRSIADILATPAATPQWGFKEIWNGSSHSQHPWSLYDDIFPNATYIHLIRDPLQFALSCADFSGALTPAFIGQRLHDWVGMLQYNRERSATGRYFELRYEDLIADPQTALAPILTHLNCDWHDSIKNAQQQQKYVPSPSRDRDTEQRLLLKNQWHVPRLYQYCVELGYLSNIEKKRIQIGKSDDHFPETVTIPSHEFSHNTGHCYYTNLGIDDRSHLYTLYEDDRPLHFHTCNYDYIVNHGRGQYYFDFNRDLACIFFASSDNSDPRTNRKTYTLRNHDLPPTDNRITHTTMQKKITLVPDVKEELSPLFDDVAQEIMDQEHAQFKNLSTYLDGIRTENLNMTRDILERQSRALATQQKSLTNLIATQTKIASQLARLEQTIDKSSSQKIRKFFRKLRHK